MFERYTQDARRVIFFGRYEASALGSSYIESEHLLLGVLREQSPLMGALVPTLPNYDETKSAIATKRPFSGEKIPTSIDLPLSNECKRIVAYAAEEAERQRDFYIRSQHLILGMLREKTCLAAELLREHGAELQALRLKIPETIGKKSPSDEPPTMYCKQCNQDRAPLTCRHCSVAICHVCGNPLLGRQT